MQSGGPNLSLFEADPALLHSRDSAKNSPTVGNEKEKLQVFGKEEVELVKKKEEDEAKRIGIGDEEVVSKLTLMTTTSLPTRKPLPVNEPKPVLPPSKQLRMVRCHYCHNCYHRSNNCYQAHDHRNHTTKYNQGRDCYHQKLLKLQNKWFCCTRAGQY